MKIKNSFLLYCICVITVILFAYITTPFFVHYFKENKDTIEAYEIVLSKNGKIEERFITFDYPQLKGNVVRFSCAQNQCPFSITYTGDIRIHSVHLNKKLQIIGKKYSGKRTVEHIEK